MEIPPINKRILRLIKYYANNQMIDFSKNIQIPENDIAELFTIHKRTRDYTIPNTKILISIITTYPEVDANWLLSGKGEMFFKSRIDKIYNSLSKFFLSLIYEKEKIIKEQAIEIGHLTERIRLMQLKK